MAQKPGSIPRDKQKYIKRAIESACEYNVFLNRQRQRVYIDLQTDTPNYPVGLGRQNKTLTSTEKIGRYPVAVMPDQYQDWYIEYTPEELRFLPVDTVLRGPIMRIDELPPVLTTPDVSDFGSDSESCCSTASNESSSCCSQCAVDETQNGHINHHNHHQTNRPDEEEEQQELQEGQISMQKKPPTETSVRGR